MSTWLHGPLVKTTAQQRDEAGHGPWALLQPVIALEQAVEGGLAPAWASTSTVSSLGTINISSSSSLRAQL